MLKLKRKNEYLLYNLFHIMDERNRNGENIAVHKIPVGW